MIAVGWQHVDSVCVCESKWVTSCLVVFVNFFCLCARVCVCESVCVEHVRLTRRSDADWLCASCGAMRGGKTFSPPTNIPSGFGLVWRAALIKQSYCLSVRRWRRRSFHPIPSSPSLLSSVCVCVCNSNIHTHTHTVCTTTQYTHTHTHTHILFVFMTEAAPAHCNSSNGLWELRRRRWKPAPPFALLLLFYCCQLLIKRRGPSFFLLLDRLCCCCCNRIERGWRKRKRRRRKRMDATLMACVQQRRRRRTVPPPTLVRRM